MNTLRIHLSFFLFQAIALLSNGQSSNTVINARSLGLGNASSTLSDDWSLLNNVGGLGKVKTTSVAVAYEAKPGLVGANRMAAAFSIPTRIGTGGVGVVRFGDDLYNEQIVSSGFSNTIGNTSLGLKINYIQYRAIGFETRSAVSFNFGGITELSSKVSIGAYITNINQPRLSTVNTEKVPAQLVVGVSFKPTESVLIATEIDKDLTNDPVIKAGLEYKIHRKVFARSGFNLKPEAFFLGMGFVNSNLKIDYALQYTQLLNYSFQASIVYSFKKSKRKDE